MVSESTAVDRIDTLQAVELAEGVEVRLRVAGPLPRMLAYGLDLLISGVALMLFGIVAAVIGLVIGARVSMGLFLLSAFLVSWWYPVLFEVGKHGATLGKMVFGLRVVQTTGVPITFGQAVVRNFLRFVDMQPVPTNGVGLVSCLSTRRFQRLGDLAAGTLVVYQRREIEVAASGDLKKVVSEPPPVALRPEEARALVEFRERAGDWSEARRRELADHLEPITGESGGAGVAKLISMAEWLRNER